MDDEIENANMGPIRGAEQLPTPPTKIELRKHRKFCGAEMLKSALPVILNVDLLWHRNILSRGRDGNGRTIQECENFME